MSKSNPDDVRNWIEDVLDEKLDGDLFDSLRDGVKICRIADKISPGSAPFKKSNMPFVQMENIASFLRASETIGVPHHELFETVDLFENQNPDQVLITLRSLSRHAHQKNAEIPVIGPKLTSPNRRIGGFKPSDIPAWNERQYGFMGGASQGSERVVMGGRRDIISPSSAKSPTSPPPPPVASEKPKPSPPPKPYRTINLSNVRPAGAARAPRGPRDPWQGFGDHNSSDDGMDERDTQPLIRSAKSAVSSRRQAQQQAKLDLDDDMYAYDEVYDEIKPHEVKKDKTAATDKAHEAKVVASMLAANEQRKQDRLRAMDTKLKREREKEGDEFEGVETFVTSGYKKAQEEMKQAAKVEEQEQEQKLRKGGMQKFMLNMMERQHNPENVETAPVIEQEKVIPKAPTTKSPSPQPTSSSSRQRKRPRRDETADFERQVEESRRKQEEEEGRRIKELAAKLTSTQTSQSSIEAARARFLERRKNNK